VELSPVLKPSIGNFLSERQGFSTGRAKLCYDVGVKRSAVAQGVKQGRLLAKHLLPAVWKPIHSLWNEVIGFLFLCLAIIFGFQAARHFHDHDWRVYMAFPVIALLLWFGIDAFLRARKISRS
jgi:hypothetical protein